MKQVRLGRTAIEVGVVGFGALQIATKLSSSASTRLIHHACDSGVTLFDTAHSYFDSEEKLGRALRGRRHRVVLVTKAGVGDAATFAQRIDEALRRLRTDYIDVYMVHGLDRAEQVERVLGPGGLMDVLRAAQRAGKVRWVGFSGHVPEVARQCIETRLFDVALYPLSFMNREARSRGVLSAARRANAGFLAMKPFGGGRIDRGDWAIGYVKQFADVVPVIGFERCEQIDEVIRLYGRPIRFSARQSEEMERFRRRVGRFFCRGCGYCMPCPQGISIKSVTFWPVIYEQLGAAKSISPGVLAAAQKAAECTRCGQCVERCPYTLDIPGMLVRNRKRVAQVAHRLGLL